jgi:SecD/SecF fusion protein
VGNRRRNLFILLFVAGLFAASLVVILSKPTVLGLDLRGGTELVYQGRPTPQNPKIDGQDIDRSIEIIRKRTDKLGVAEPEISRVGADSIRVSLPDVSNADRAKDQVGTTAQLYFYDWEPNVIAEPGSTNGTSTPITSLYDAVQLASKQKPECPEGQCTASGPTYYLFDANTKEIAAGPAATRADLYLDPESLPDKADREIVAVPQGTIVVQAEAPPDDPNTAEIDESKTGLRGYYVIEDRPELSGNDIRDPKQGFDPTTNQPIVTFSFTDKGQQAFQDVTRRIAERGLSNAPPGTAGNSLQASQFSGSFAVVLDKEVVSRPIINFVDNPAGIDGRTGAQIEGNFNIEEAQDLANFLQIGALPIDLKLISQTTVSATLGQTALEQGLRAGIAGLLLVLLFLILYYRFLGVVASVGLLVYAAFFFALVKLIPITLTLPGIAGLILTIGVAADSNIVIFERIKEEFRTGRSIRSAIATGYRKGIATIIDANVITLITAFILFVLATSGVKGFAFTLGIGTIVSLFTAVVFTQAFLGVFGQSKLLESGKLIGAGEEKVRWRFDFAGASKWFFSVSGAILLVGAISFAVSQFNFGLDFESGSSVTVGLEESATIEEVRSTLAAGGVPNTGQAQITEVTSEDLGQNGFQIEANLSPSQATEIQPVLNEAYGVTTFDNTTVGPTFGAQVAKGAALAILFSLLVICGYVAIRFEPKYAVPVIIAVIHDVLITAGVYSVSGREVTSGTVAAFLTILGYSLYDTVIVFDRVRENVPRLPRAAFSQIVNKSMSEVLTRSLITGLSSVFLVGVLFIFGGATLKDFAFAMMIGIASGTYSSIFIATPVLTAWKEREPQYRRRRDRIEEQLGIVPPFPDDSMVAKVTPEDTSGADRSEQPSAPSDAEPPAGPPPSSSPIPGVLGDQPAPVPVVEPPPEEAGQAAGDDAAEEAPDLSDASAEALKRVRARRGKKKRGGN